MTAYESTLRLTFVPGVTLRKWTSTWEQRYPETALEVTPREQPECLAAVRDGLADCAFVRLPIDREGLSVIRLYGEVPVLVVPRGHEVSQHASLTLEHLEGLEGVVGFPSAGSVKDAVALVAAGVGFLRLPHSLARLHARKDVSAIPISDAEETEIALVWLAAGTTPLIEEFVGIVRGRTPSSSRGQGSHAAAKAGTTRVSDRAQPRTPRSRSRKGRA